MTSERPIRILLVDDDEDDYFIFKDLLTKIRAKNFQIDWTASFETGKSALAEKNHDICFLDYRLGGRTGLDLLKEAITEGCKIPIIVLTGNGEPEADLEAMKLGAADYLVKDQISSFISGSELLERCIRYSIHRAQSIQAILEREAQILMQDRLASVGLLASSLAHEIGTPLAVIRGRAEYLELQLRNDPNIKKNVDIIISQIDRVSKLIRSLLNLARGDQMKSSGQIFANNTVTEVVELMAHEFRKHEIEIKNELTQNYPVKVRAEAGPLHQVLLNLLVNSVHAIETAIIKGRDSGHFIRISVRELETQWSLNIEDTGSGISEKNLKNLFKPFFTTKEIGVGTGLGLVTSYRIVESWGGTIQVKSTEGRGTEFQILLPKVTSTT